jgi:hypothetical protein
MEKKDLRVSVTDMTSAKRKRDESDEGTAPLGGTARNPRLRVPVTEGGNPDRKRAAGASVAANALADPTIPSEGITKVSDPDLIKLILDQINKSKNALADYLESVIPEHMNKPIKDEEKKEPNPDEKPEWDENDNYTTRLRKSSVETFLKGFHNNIARMAIHSEQYDLIVDSILAKMGVNPMELGEPSKLEAIKRTAAAYIKLIGKVAYKLP